VIDVVLFLAADRRESRVVVVLPVPRSRVADAVPGARTRDVVLVLAGASLTALRAQISIHVPRRRYRSPARRSGSWSLPPRSGRPAGGASQLLYVLAGLLPVHAGGTHGWAVLPGPTGGYLVGFRSRATGSAGWLSMAAIDALSLRSRLRHRATDRNRRPVAEVLRRTAVVHSDP
jgi:BioY family